MKFLVAITLSSLNLTYQGFVVMKIWNWFVSEPTGFSTISLGTAVAFVILIHLLLAVLVRSASEYLSERHSFNERWASAIFVTSVSLLAAWLITIV